MKKTGYKTKKVWCVILMISLLAGILSGCASGSENTEGAPDNARTETESALSDEGTNGEENGEITPVTLTVFIDMPRTIDDWQWGDDYVSQEITKRTGVSLEIVNATTNDHQELSVMLASEEDLPDLVVVSPSLGMSMIEMMIGQGFAAPLNKLADEYCPEFWDVLPTDMDTVHNWSDGNLYYLSETFGDAERVDELKEPFSPLFNFMLNMDMYEELGSPSIDTLEELREVLKEAKEKFGTDFTIFDGQTQAADNDANMAQAINRLMGGTDVYSIQEDGTVRLNFQDEEYYNACKYINSLYRDGTFNQENFTVTTEQLNQILADREMFAYFGHNWQILSGYEGGFAADAPYRILDYPISANVNPGDVKLKDSYAAVSGTRAILVMEDSENLDRAIEYLTFLLSDEGQILMREGVEGVTYTLDDEGIPRPTELRLEYEAGPADELQRVLGMNNPQFAWPESGWVLALARHLRIENEPYYKAQLDTARPYRSWERLNILAGIITDTDLLAIRTQIFELWKNALPGLYLAETDEEFDKAYNKLISDAKTLGLDQLEAAYTENYQKYYERGVR